MFRIKFYRIQCTEYRVHNIVRKIQGTVHTQLFFTSRWSSVKLNFLKILFAFAWENKFTKFCTIFKGKRFFHINLIHWNLRNNSKISAKKYNFQMAKKLSCKLIHMLHMFLRLDKYLRVVNYHCSDCILHNFPKYYYFVMKI